MTPSWQDMARTALAGSRIWRDALRASPHVPPDLAFGEADVIVLSLLLDLTDGDTVVCADDRLGRLLAAVWAEQGVERRLLAAANGSPALELTSVRALGAGRDGITTRVCYGLRGGIPLADCAPTAWDVVLRPLSSAAPALWQCGLALIAPESGQAAATALIEQLALTMHGDWIDPLLLYERVQVLTAKLKGLGELAEPDPDSKRDRIAELEHEIASLKRAALVNQHLLLVDAAERTRGLA